MTKYTTKESVKKYLNIIPFQIGLEIIIQIYLSFMDVTNNNNISRVQRKSVLWPAIQESSS